MIARQHVLIFPRRRTGREPRHRGPLPKKMPHEDRATEDDSQTKCHTFSFFVPGDLDLWLLTLTFELERDFLQFMQLPSFIILRLIIQKLSCWQTDKLTNNYNTVRWRWKHPPCSAMLRRWVISILGLLCYVCMCIFVKVRIPIIWNKWRIGIKCCNNWYMLSMLHILRYIIAAWIDCTSSLQCMWRMCVICWQKGANVNAKDVDGNTPLSLAVMNGHERSVRDLLTWFNALRWVLALKKSQLMDEEGIKQVNDFSWLGHYLDHPSKIWHCW